ncbi:MAG: glycosyltransferase family 39 protein, partial [Gemmatimonadales bacterium]|nr:glycosyltransferase family 39 protein [Gemmatimonadales bacterium]
MPAPDPHALRPPLATRALLALAALKVLLHASVLTRYGWFRDELYYVVCADHPAAGYVDHPPLSIWLLAAWRALAGDSLAAVRLPAVLAGAAAVFMAGVLARELYGGRYSQALAALAALSAPMFLAVGHFYSMNAWEPLLWSLAAWLTLRALGGGGPRAWLLLGLVLGLAILNKLSALWLVAGLGVGLVASPHRDVLRTRWPWLALAIAALVAAPHLAWQVANGWPTAEFMANAAGRKMVATGFTGFWAQQGLAMNPVLLPLWLAGLAWLVWGRHDPRGRVLGVAWLVVAAILLAAGRSRPNYLAPAYLPLFAAGAVLLEAALDRPGWRHFRSTAMAVIVGGGMIAAPLAMPLLPVERLVEYMARLGMTPRAEERSGVAELPQHFADQHGWPALVDEVLRVVATLPPEERGKAVVFTQNYGEAGALTVLGRGRGVPPVISGHNNFWLWGPGPADATVVIIVGGDEADHRRALEQVERAGTWRAPWVMPYERNLPIYVGRGLKAPLS